MEEETPLPQQAQEPKTSFIIGVADASKYSQKKRAIGIKNPKKRP